MSTIKEGPVLLANLFGSLAKTDAEGVYRFSISLQPEENVGVYMTYLQRRFRHLGWQTNTGVEVEPVSDIQPAEYSNGLSVLVKPLS